ncbi:MAG TPA: MFS transporter [Desulfobulbus sp.]|nr:MFS transporter [Desulfobulbus sp.]
MSDPSQERSSVAGKKRPSSLSGGSPRAYLGLLRANPSYRRFWSAGVISQAGDWFNYIAIFVLLSRLTGSGEAVSWFLIAKFLPSALLGPLAGVVADRFRRKTILVSCDLCRAALVLCYLLAGRLEMVWLIYLLAFVQESLWTFSHPARQASIPDLCRPEELNVANGLSGSTWSIMLAMGAALGGFVTAVFGWQTAIMIDAGSFLVSAGLLSGVPLPMAPHRRKGPLSLARLTGLADLVEGLRYVLAHRRVAALLMVKSGWALSGGILVMLTVFGEQVFAHGGRGGLSGVLYSMRGLGAAVGPILAWRLFGDSRQGMRRAIGLAFFISSLAYLLFSQAPGIVTAALCVFLGHVGGAIQWVFSTTLLHHRVEARFRGRVFAAEMTLLTLVLSLSSWLTGLSLDRGADPRTIVLCLALLFLLPGTLWILYLGRLRAGRS